MNYQHAFHAGNHADILKHLVLWRSMCYLKQKKSPISYLDSHSGQISYDLNSIEARKTGEINTGFLALPQVELPKKLLQEFIQTAVEISGGVDLYPGSAAWAIHCARAGDYVYLNELQPKAFSMLSDQVIRLDSLIPIMLSSEDAFAWIKRVIPTKTARALLLMDPPYENGKDWLSVLNAMKWIAHRMRHATVLLWYPIKNRRSMDYFYRGLQGSGASKLMCLEMCIHKPDNEVQLNGSGMAVINPPWGMIKDLEEVLPILTRLLAGAAAEIMKKTNNQQGDWRIFWPIPEA